MSKQWDLDDLIAGAEAARILGVSRAAISNTNRKNGARMIEPVFTPTGGAPLYSRREVESRIAQRRESIEAQIAALTEQLNNL